jgi:hypothetical protein
MRCTERLIGGSCIRLAFIRESIPLKKKKNKVYTHLFTFLAFRLIYMYANETFEKWNCVLVVPTEEYKVLPWKSAGLHGKREFCQNGETLSDEVENRYFHFHINSSSTKATWMVYLHGPGTSGLFQFLFPPFLFSQFIFVRLSGGGGCTFIFQPGYNVQSVSICNSRHRGAKAEENGNRRALTSLSALLPPPPKSRC